MNKEALGALQNQMLMLNGYSEMVLSSLSKEDRGYEDVEGITRAAARAALLCYEVATETQPHPRRLDLNEFPVAIASRLAMLLDSEVPVKGLRGASSSEVWADPDLLEHALGSIIWRAQEWAGGLESVMISASNGRLELRMTPKGKLTPAASRAAFDALPAIDWIEKLSGMIEIAEHSDTAIRFRIWLPAAAQSCTPQANKPTERRAGEAAADDETRSGPGFVRLTRSMFVPLTPLRFLHRAQDLFGSKIGVISGDRSFTYAEFGERVERLASGLTRLGVEPGDRVAYLSFNNHQLLEGYYAVPQAKAMVMPLNVRLSPPELINILNHSGARLLLFENDFLPLIEQLRASCKGIEKFITLDAAVPGADLTVEEVMAQGRPGRADIFSFQEFSIAELFYTSGSTGTPKGVTLSHRTLYLHALDAATLAKDHETMVDLHTIPLFHANGWGRPHVSTMLGIQQVMVRRFEPAGVFGLVQQYRATHMSLVPTMANALINFPDRAKFDLTSLRQVTIGGAASSPELVERVEATLGCECISGYGLTETCPLLTTSRYKGTFAYADDAERRRYQAMAGWPAPGVEVRVVDIHMNDVPQDMESIGEVIARGDHVMEGYYKEPEQTNAVMTDKWFHTGDMAVWSSEGYIHIVDRKKEIIISGGENISSIEVEKAIFAHPAVFECAVVSAPDPQWGEVPAAMVVTKPGHSLTGDELLEFLKKRLGKFKLPRVITVQTEPLAKTGTGKIRKNILREQFWQGKEKRVQG